MEEEVGVVVFGLVSYKARRFVKTIYKFHIFAFTGPISICKMFILMFD